MSAAALANPTPADRGAELEAKVERLFVDRRIPAFTRALWREFYRSLRAPDLEDLTKICAALEAKRLRMET